MSKLFIVFVLFSPFCFGGNQHLNFESGKLDGWKIVEGKLYLNLNKAVQKKWLSDVPGNLEPADRVWSGIQGVSIAKLNAE